MTIYIEGSHGELYAKIGIKNDKVIESSLRGVGLTDVDENENGLVYILETQSAPYTLKSVSNEGLLKEIAVRLSGDDETIEDISD